MTQHSKRCPKQKLGVAQKIICDALKTKLIFLSPIKMKIYAFF